MLLVPSPEDKIMSQEMKNMSPTSEGATPSPGAERSRSLPEFSVASSLAEVQEAWSLVHDAYCRIGLIDRNRHGLHTVPNAVSPATSVIVGKVDQKVVSTLSIIPEAQQPIPLQKIYPDELDALRASGHKLLEVGLLADRREHISRAMVSIFEMMRYVFWRSYLTHTDIIIGVHPHHSGFYINSFGFTQIGQESTHPLVKDHPVVLLRLDLHTTLKIEPVPKRLIHYVNNPLTDEDFANRYNFDPQEVEASVIGSYLKEKTAQAQPLRHAC